MTSNPIKLKIPAQDLEAPTRFAADAASAAQWLRGIAGDAQVDELSDALQELNRCAMSPSVRYEIAEVLRPRAEQAGAQLARQYLNQSPLISDQVVRQADRAARLYTLLGTAYTIAAVEVLTRRGVDNAAKLACEALHRALRCAGREVLQTMQLYRPMHMYGWLRLHQLYALAEQQTLADLPVPDPQGSAPTIKTLYLQALLLGCCQPNRLRQSDLGALHTALAQWSAHAGLRSTPTADNLFVVDLGRDQPPLPRSFLPEDAAGQLRHVDTHALHSHLQGLYQEAVDSGATIERESRLPINVLQQVMEALHAQHNRGFKRVSSSSSVSLSLGLKNCHFHVASGLIFEQVLYGAVFGANRVFEENRFAPPKPSADIWQRANPHDEVVHEEPEQSDETVELDIASRARVFRDEEKDGLEESVAHYPVFRAPLADVSPGGYCLELDPTFPGVLRTGELLCLREHENTPWQIAVIRWLYMPSESRLLAGLELLSPQAKALGACVEGKSGDLAPPVRALLLPAIKIIGQPPTLLTPRAGFRVRQKITLVTAKGTLRVRLTELTSYTGSYSQFAFDRLHELGDMLSDRDNELTGGKDSLWTTI